MVRTRWERYARMYTRRFFGGYIECAFWATNDESDESGGVPLDENFSPHDLAPESLKEMESEVAAFIFSNRKLLRASGLDPERAGHDFWLTRNGHGAGFWDEGLGKIGEELTKASKAYGEIDLIVDSNGTIHCS